MQPYQKRSVILIVLSSAAVVLSLSACTAIDKREKSADQMIIEVRIPVLLSSFKYIPTEAFVVSRLQQQFHTNPKVVKFDNFW